MCSTERYDPQYQKSSEGQQEIPLAKLPPSRAFILPQSDLTEHRSWIMLPKAKLNGIYNVDFIKKSIDSIIHYFSMILSMLGNKEIGL